MATPENTQVVRDLYAAFGRGHSAAACALVAEDVVWHLPGTVPHYSGTYKGSGGVAAFFQELTTTVGIEAFEPQEFVTAANRVLVTGWSRARVKTTGRTVQ